MPEREWTALAARPGEPDHGDAAGHVAREGAGAAEEFRQDLAETHRHAGEGRLGPERVHRRLLALDLGLDVARGVVDQVVALHQQHRDVVTDVGLDAGTADGERHREGQLRGAGLVDGRLLDAAVARRVDRVEVVGRVGHDHALSERLELGCDHVDHAEGDGVRVSAVFDQDRGHDRAAGELLAGAVRVLH